MSPGHPIRLGSLLVALVLLLAPSPEGPGNLLDRMAFDALAPTPPDSTPVAGVAITPEDLSALPRFGVEPGTWPWKRLAHGAVVHALQKMGARSLAFTLFFERPGEARSDAGLVREIRTSDMPVHLAAYQTPSPFPSGRAPLPGLDLGLESARAQGLEPQEYGLLHPPLPALADVAAGIGVVNLPPEGLTLSRSFPLVYRDGNRLLPSLALAACLPRDLDPGQLRWEPGPTLVLPGLRLPLTPSGRVLVRLTPAPAHRVSELLETFSRALGPSPAYQNRVVFVGLEGTALGIHHEVPGGRRLPSYQLQAALARALLGGTLVRPLDRGLLLLLLLTCLAPIVLSRPPEGTPLRELLLPLGLALLLPLVLLPVGSWASPSRLLIAVLLAATPPWISRVLESRSQRLQREAEMGRAEEVSRSLLPVRLPVGVRGMLQPARVAAGDHYDALDFEDGSLLAMVADVSGKGLDAAMVASQVRTAFRALARPGEGPAALLGRLNAFLHDDLEQAERLVTLVLARRSPDGNLEVAGAAHPPVLVLGPEAPARRLEARGRPLGYAPDTRYRQVEDRLAPGEWALLLSDGVLEESLGEGGERPGVPGILARLEALRSAGDLDPTSVARNLLAPGAPADDQTLVFVAGPEVGAAEN